MQLFRFMVYNSALHIILLWRKTLSGLTSIKKNTRATETLRDNKSKQSRSDWQNHRTESCPRSGQKKADDQMYGLLSFTSRFGLIDNLTVRETFLFLSLGTNSQISFCWPAHRNFKWILWDPFWEIVHAGEVLGKLNLGIFNCQCILLLSIYLRQPCAYFYV